MHAVTVLALVTALLLPADPTPDGETLLRRLDAAGRRAADSDVTLAVTVHHPDGTAVERTLRVWQRGGDRRMVKFLAPARLRGTGILVPDGSRVFVYLPAYKRVREVTGREGGDAFMGTDFSIDELALVRLAPGHTATLEAEATDTWTLRLVPRTPADKEYAALRVTMRKADDLLAGMEYLDAAGAPYRSVALTDVRSVGAYAVAHHFEVRDLRSGRRTTAVASAVTFDQGLAEDFFSERQLTR